MMWDGGIDQEVGLHRSPREATAVMRQTWLPKAGLERSVVWWNGWVGGSVSVCAKGEVCSSCRSRASTGGRSGGKQRFAFYILERWIPNFGFRLYHKISFSSVILPLGLHRTLESWTNQNSRHTGSGMLTLRNPDPYTALPVLLN